MLIGKLQGVNDTADSIVSITRRFRRGQRHMLKRVLHWLDAAELSSKLSHDCSFCRCWNGQAPSCLVELCKPTTQAAGSNILPIFQNRLIYFSIHPFPLSLPLPQYAGRWTGERRELRSGIGGVDPMHVNALLRYFDLRNHRSGNILKTIFFYKK